MYRQILTITLQFLKILKSFNISYQSYVLTSAYVTIFHYNARLGSYDLCQQTGRCYTDKPICSYRFAQSSTRWPSNQRGTRNILQVRYRADIRTHRRDEAVVLAFPGSPVWYCRRISCHSRIHLSHDQVGIYRRKGRSKSLCAST